jgi:hypothetical protein
MTFGVASFDLDDAVPERTTFSPVALSRVHPTEDCADSKTINAAAVARLADLSRAIMVSPRFVGVRSELPEPPLSAFVSRRQPTGRHC